VQVRYAAVGFLYHAATRQVLLHHRDSHAAMYPECWAGFGGMNEPQDGGDPMLTWRREMREELGIELQFGQVRPLRQYVNPDVGRPRYVFYAEWPALGDSFALGEGDGYRWFPLDAAIALPDLMTLAHGDLVYFRDTVALQDAIPNQSSPPSPPPLPPDDGASDLRQELYLIADEMRGAATLWRRFAANVYEAERADQAMQLASRIAALADGRAQPEIAAMFDDEGWMRVSPAVGVDALVFNERGEVLLVKRRDNQHWCMPGGIAEIGQSPAESALKELWEEAGLRGETVRLVGVFDGRRWGSRALVHMIHLTFLVRCAELTPEPGIEMLEARFFPADALPQPLHPGHDRWLPACLELARTGATHADPATSYDAELPMHQRPGH
jgi:8-oxo-dGTP pyrophosphatase MutT (NUDIX family)